MTDEIDIRPYREGDETGILAVPDLEGRNVAVLPNLLDAPDGGPAFFDRVLTRHSLRREDLASVRPLVLEQAAKEFERGELDAAMAEKSNEPVEKAVINSRPSTARKASIWNTSVLMEALSPPNIE